MPAWRIRAALTGSVSTASMAPDSSAGSPGGTSTATSCVSWGRFPTALATSGAPHAIASSAVNPKPSCVDGRTTTAACRYSDASSTSSTAPLSTRRRRRRQASAARRSASGPSAPTSARGGPPPGSRSIACRRVSSPLRGSRDRRLPTQSTKGSSSPRASAVLASRSLGRAENTAPTPCGTTWIRDGSRSRVAIASIRVVSLTAMIPAHARIAGARSAPKRRRAEAATPGTGAPRHISTSWRVTTWRDGGKPITGSPPSPWIRCGCLARASESTWGCARRNRAGRASLHAGVAGTDGVTSRPGASRSASISWVAYRPIPASRRPSPRQLASSRTRRGLCIEAL